VAAIAISKWTEAQAVQVKKLMEWPVWHPTIRELVTQSQARRKVAPEITATKTVPLQTVTVICPTKTEHHPIQPAK